MTAASISAAAPAAGPGPSNAWARLRKNRLAVFSGITLLVLALVCGIGPLFAQDYTANKLKIATTPAAVKGFEYLQEANQKGWYQKDYATTKFELVPLTNDIVYRRPP